MLFTQNIVLKVIRKAIIGRPAGFLRLRSCWICLCSGIFIFLLSFCT